MFPYTVEFGKAFFIKTNKFDYSTELYLHFSVSSKIFFSIYKFLLASFQ